MRWDRIFTDWARSRGHGVNAALGKVLGTPYYVEARRRFKAGATEAELRALLDKAHD